LLTLLGLTLGFTLLFVLAGLIPGTVLASTLTSNNGKRGPLTIGIAVGVGFAISAIAASWSFGLIGADSYFGIFAGITLATFSLLLSPLVRSKFGIWREFERTDLLLLLIPVLTSFLARPFWDGMRNLRISAGNGPDIPQNLMTVLAQPGLGSTWLESKSAFLNFLGEKNLSEAVYHLYQLPSMQQQAGVDYLVYGTRWGLSVPFAQLIRVNREWLIIGQGLTLSVGLLALGLIIYGFSRITFNRHALSVMLTVATISGAPLVIQFFNGGMAQAWSLPGLGLISIAVALFIMISSQGPVTKSQLISLMTLFMVGWLANAVTYIDSSMALAAALAVCILLLAIFASRKLSGQLFALISVGGLMAALVVAPYTYAAISTMGIRLKLAAGTGIMFNHWPLPSEMLGVFNIWTGEAGKPRDPATLILGLIFSVGLIYLVSRGIFSKSLFDRTMSILGLSIVLVCVVIAIWAKNSNVGSNYSYIKVATYLSPLFLIVVAERMSENLRGKSARNPKNDTPLILRMVLPITYVVIIVGSSFQLNSNLIKQAEFSIPRLVMPILNDAQAQKELSDFNYLTSYRALSNVLGFVGNTYWISKAPNDIRLETRMGNELRIICLNGDNMCNPQSNEIIDTKLNPYGFRVFESPITTEQFAKLTPRERYFAAMDAVGQQRFEVPERFIGGNPLLNP
jgi:hypothetical protein